MTKIIALGDTHGVNKWKEIVKQSFDKVIFLGDYFDSFSIKFGEQYENFMAILDFKKANPDKVVLLFGNHDFHYITNERYSGYQLENADIIGGIIRSTLEQGQLELCHQESNFIFSHAGITKTWMNEHNLKNGGIVSLINLEFLNSPNSFKFTPSNPLDNCGESITQPPIWVRPEPLLRDKIDGIKQVVGHTKQKNIDINGDVIFIDTLEYSNEYLIIKDGVPEVGTI